MHRIWSGNLLFWFPEPWLIGTLILLNRMVEAMPEVLSEGLVGYIGQSPITVAAKAIQMIADSAFDHGMKQEAQIAVVKAMHPDASYKKVLNCRPINHT